MKFFPWRSRTAKLIAAAALLAALYLAADWRAVGRVLAALDARYFAASLALFIPQTLLSARRWRMLANSVAPVNYADALRHTAIAAAWNLIVPSKLGDLSKATLIPDLSAPQRAAVGGLVVVEKLADVAALGALILLGFAGEQLLSSAAFLGFAVASGSQGSFVRRLANKLAAARLSPGMLARLALMSLALWCLHLWQIELFMRSAGVIAPWQVVAARLPVAIFAGLLPVSFCGIGTRDAALVWLFADIAPASAMAAVGLLTALRYLAPGAVGIAVLAADSSRVSAAPAASSR
jgi:hypothetical protein